MNLRNLEQIQEYDQGPRGLPWGTLLLAAAAGGALVVALMTTLERQAPPAESKVDPLQQLVAEAQKDPAAPAGMLSDEQVTFPSLLSDQGAPTTAMAAVKDERGRLLKREQQGAIAPSNHDGLPHLVMPTAGGGASHPPMPVGDLLSSTTVTQQPKDELSQLAKSRVEIHEAQLAPMGAEGGFEIQVASFREIKDADAFVEELRKREHRAYRQAAYVAGRGLWHRVRIGPFKAKYQALAYQAKLEDQERISTFLVDPAKVKRQLEIRDAKAAAREKKKKRREARAAAAAKSSQ